jgi:pimeloyl-ACP methyl ester carboxylesterase
VADSSDFNPHALGDGPQARIAHYEVAGTRLYAEVRGSGPAVLLIGAADEDAEFYRPVAERLAGELTVVTYDRRGTRRSGREDWPGGGSAQHADDAAALLAALGIDRVTVVGFSAGAIVALQVALRHPQLVQTAFCFEPGYFRLVPGGATFQRLAQTTVEDHLAAHPDDWAGASAALGRAAAGSLEPSSRGLFTPPEGQEWYGDRGDANAEALLRGDLPLTREAVGDEEVASCPANIRFAYGTASLSIFEEITSHLAAARGTTPDPLEGVGHGAFFHPEAIAAYIRDFIE